MRAIIIFCCGRTFRLAKFTTRTHNIKKSNWDFSNDIWNNFHQLKIIYNEPCQTKNINNLISLWKIVGNSFQKQFSQNNISHCYISDSEWPNRIWFDGKVTLEMLKTATEIARNAPIPLTVSSFDCKLLERF